MKYLIGFFKFLNFGLVVATLLAYLAPYVDPRDFWPLIFFGLAYPVFLIGNLFFIGFWFFVKRRLVWISSLTLIIGVGYIPQVFGFNFSTPKEQGNLKVLTLNTGGFYQFRNNGKFKKEGFSKMINFLKNEANDIVCFQEFSEYYGKTIIENKSLFSSYDNTNSAIFTGAKGNISSSGKFEFEKVRTNGISWTNIKIQEKTIRVYNLHLKSTKISSLINQFNFRSDFFSKKGHQYLKKAIPRYKNSAIIRVEMVEELRTELKKCPYPVIVCGDMNQPPYSYVYREMSRDLKDAFVEKGFGFGTTYNGKIPGLRIDYIFVSPEIEVVDFKIIKNDFSDHFPVICNLKLSEG